MAVSRRRFLISGLALATGAVAAGVGTVRIGSGRLRAWYYALPDEAATRGLSPQCERTLVRVVETLVDEPVETAHYSDFFRWRAEHLSGHGAFYERLARLLDDHARRRAGRPFADCDASVRREIIAPVSRLRESSASRLRLTIFGRDWLLFEHYVATPALDLFSHTDAWVRAGYDSWPGRPTGLDAYLSATSTGDSRPPGKS